GRHEIGPSRRRWSRLASLLCTQYTVRLVRQALKRFGLVGALALGRDGLEWGLGRSTGWARPEVGQHDAQPEEDEDHQVIVHQVWNHGITPLHSGVRGHFTGFLSQGNYPPRRGTRPELSLSAII